MDRDKVLNDALKEEMMEGEEVDMKNIFTDVFEEGKQEGKQEGRQDGKQEEKMNNIQILMKNLKLSVREAMDLLEVPKEDRDKLMKLL